MARDPKLDPKPGDTLLATTALGKRTTRKVIKRVNNDVTYRVDSGKVRTCWITTWMDWAREAEVQ